MSCRICLELSQFLTAANEVDPPEVLVGLSEKGLRNRMQQKQERLNKITADVERHAAACTESAGVTAGS